MHIERALSGEGASASRNEDKRVREYHMPLFIRRLVRAALVLLVLGVIANDVVRTGAAVSRASDAMTAGMSAAQAVAAVTPSDVEAARADAEAAAAEHGATLDSYNQVTLTQGASRVVRISLTTRDHVQSAVVAPAILGLMNGTPAAEWYGPEGAPLIVGQTREVEVYGSVSL